MTVTKKNALFAALSLLLVAACGQKPSGGLPQNQVEAEQYFKQFAFKRGPIVGNSYCQSPQLGISGGQGTHGKFNLFLNKDDNTFTMEYTELQNASGSPLRGTLQGAVINGQWFVKDTTLFLQDGDKKIAEGVGKIAGTGDRVIVLKFNHVNLRDYNSNLVAQKISSSIDFKYVTTSRVLPADLKSGLVSSMQRRDGRGDEGFPD